MKMTKKERLLLLAQDLKKAYPDAVCSLDNATDPWKLLVSAILATQCTDKRVNMVTPALFAKFPQIADFAAATPEDVMPYIRSTGFFNHKAQNIVGSAKKIMTDFGGKVPQTMDELTALPGVGRKIANLLIGDCFGGDAIVVDTHCKRITYRMGLTKQTDPTKIEMELWKIMPPGAGSDFCHRIVYLGREFCVRNPKCDICPVSTYCKKVLK